jgi:hypothetical protein
MVTVGPGDPPATKRCTVRGKEGVWGGSREEVAGDAPHAAGAGTGTGAKPGRTLATDTNDMSRKRGRLSLRAAHDSRRGGGPTRSNDGLTRSSFVQNMVEGVWGLKQAKY